ncbi:lysozyme inhibitor LprI family protein [Paraburkholderia sp. SIMBA_009]|uniref:lysozyme inhibitor LprI family protein n=1 Tax=Paraburkholderia tropica TaxID=92647 RepID=UPI002AB76596|nr:lysozyme inhibitor LprI family protein [Paraburkholderia tropica]
MIVVGALVALAGVGGFIDTRKADRRFKTGYKNNEPDTRNFARAGRFVLYGIGICVIGAAINSFTGSNDETPPEGAVNDQSASVAQSVQAPASETTESTEIAPTVNQNVAQAPSEDSDRAAAGELSQSSDAIVSTPDTQEHASQDGDSGESSTPASQGQTFLTSFDCRRAKADDETAICGDAGLAAMDRQLGQLYDAAMKSTTTPQALKQSESDWVITRHMCNGDRECLRHAYGVRIGQFLGSLGSKPLVETNSQGDKE